MMGGGRPCDQSTTRTASCVTFCIHIFRWIDCDQFLESVPSSCLISDSDRLSLPPLVFTSFSSSSFLFYSHRFTVASACLQIIVFFLQGFGALQKDPPPASVGLWVCERLSLSSFSIWFICFSSPPVLSLPAVVGLIMQLCPFSISFLFSSSCLTGFPVLLLSLNSSLNFSCRTLYCICLPGFLTHKTKKKCSAGFRWS